MIDTNSEEYGQKLHFLAETVASAVRTGVQFRDAFGKAFRNSSLYDPEYLNIVRIHVGGILRARKQKHPPKQLVLSGIKTKAEVPFSYPD